MLSCKQKVVKSELILKEIKNGNSVWADPGRFQFARAFDLEIIAGQGPMVIQFYKCSTTKLVRFSLNVIVVKVHYK